MAKQQKAESDLQKHKDAIHDLNRALEELRMRDFEGKDDVLALIAGVIITFEGEIPDAGSVDPGKPE